MFPSNNHLVNGTACIPCSFVIAITEILLRCLVNCLTRDVNLPLRNFRGFLGGENHLRTDAGMPHVHKGLPSWHLHLQHPYSAS